MKLRASLFLPLTFLSLISTPLSAQSGSAATPQNLLSSDQFIQSSLAVLRSIETNGAAALYDGGSVVMKRAVTRDVFIRDISAQLARTGRAVAYDWGRVERLTIPSRPLSTAQSAPAEGNFVTVLVMRTAPNGTHVAQVSFRLDEDNQWRLAGIAMPPAAAPAPSTSK